MNIRISALDALFSRYIRTRDRWTCQKCFKRYPPPTNALHCAHIFTRSKQSTRFSPLNAVALCYGCHSYLDRNPLAKYAWYVARYGQVQFDHLQRLSNTPQKVDRAAIKLWLKQELSVMELAG